MDILNLLLGRNISSLYDNETFKEIAARGRILVNQLDSRVLSINNYLNKNKFSLTAFMGTCLFDSATCTTCARVLGVLSHECGRIIRY